MESDRYVVKPIKNQYTVTIRVTTVYTIPVQAECVARAEKLANNLTTKSIEENGTMVKSDHEVVGVEKVE